MLPRVRVSHHAILRWIDRVKPALDPTRRDDYAKAKYEIETCVNRCGKVVDLPKHMTIRPDEARDTPAERIDYWIELDGLGIFFPVRDNVLLTTLCSRSIGATTRATRNKIKATDRARRRHKRERERLHGHKGIWR